MNFKISTIFLLIAFGLLSVVMVEAQDCGPSGGGAICPDPLCCSQYGYCGNGDAWCGRGCQSGFGHCQSDPTTTTTAPTPPATTTTVAPTPTSDVTATVYSSCSEPNTFSLTFDDGPYQFTSELLDYLDTKNVKVTFFVNGLNYGCIYDYADVIQRAHNSGHQIGAHTWSHPHLPSLSDDEIRTQMTELEDALRKIIGVVPRFMRLPYGDGESDPRVIGIMGELGYTHIIQWNLDSGDSLGASTSDIESEYGKISLPQTYIALNHDVYESTVRTVAPFAVERILGDGYQMQPVGTCLGTDSWYKEVVAPSPRDKSWHC